MNRREFLTVSLTGFGALLLPSQVQSVVTAEILKTSAGEILGRPLEDVYRRIRAALGPDLAVLGLHQNGGTCYVRVGFQGHTFYLKSADCVTWYTADWTPPESAQSPDPEVSHG